MTITLTARPTEDITQAQLEERMHDAQLTAYPTDDDGYEIDCADNGTADFWVERLTLWGAKVDRRGEATSAFGTQDREPNGVEEQVDEAQPGEADTDVQPS